MWPFHPPAGRTPSALWLWGFWICMVGVGITFVLSLHAPPPFDRVLRGLTGALLIVGGLHQQGVVKYKIATRGPYSTFGPHSYLISRQTGWSAIVLGVFFIASAVVGFA